ncbi:pyridoxamine 5'-phosphate oxidase family protein [Streptomyces sp. 5-8]|uniref:Pyridoxamine 5'-phosphate oxidase family protein n=1 Tax=Streptomyces musisoli TaxID=2802280 RepID=A0ABS1NYP8_9ACTN|nr:MULTISPECIES: pyridoxamine 5'-phosphate oxidase family protein [Streptomyces]MBL1105060.1 pyridoxamine 5'-phosphate oxidase family protein [Streptomyces musisoli]MBY8841148.1 pyridoxamine 5'-phosphate oxidase family protein [Streptomyces sp. SP2-10]
MGTYHAGSRAVQDLVGVRERADHVGRSLGQDIKPVAAAFLELQPLLVIGAADPGTGRVWASAVTGAPGFVRATGPRQMSVNTAHLTGRRRPDRPEEPRGGARRAATAAGARPATSDARPDGGPDPLGRALSTPGTPVGTLALDPRTRRRMRLNGHLRPTATGFAVTADQVFSNCPKHIQRRNAYEALPDRTPGTPRRLTGLDGAARESIRSADTFFLATVHSGGADVSHRGGDPGFVRVTSPCELAWPDYSGNAMFLSLGNLRADRRAGLLFLDWDTGTTLQLTGEARTEFAPDGTRTVRFTLTEARWTPAALPLRWSPPEYSPANPPANVGECDVS